MPRSLTSDAYESCASGTPRDRVVTHEPRRVRALSFHAAYACGNSGACCSAGWPIPVETHVLPVLTHALDTQLVTPAADGPPLTFPAERPPSVGAVLGRTSTGACVFFDRLQRGGHCRVHRRAGVAAMPIACRQFPRIARHDARGTDVSLSHWCPTALACLEHDDPVSIVDRPVAFDAAPLYEGLDACGAWPPLLRPDCLFDADAYDALERTTVAVLTRDGPSIPDRLAELDAWFEHLRGWHPARGSLLAQVLVQRPVAPAARTAGVWCDEALWQGVIEAIPEDLRGRVPDGIDRPAPDADAILALPHVARCVGRYLAARFFGSWVAYQGLGLRSTMASLRAGLTVVRHTLGLDSHAAPDARLRAAVRAADLLLVHLADPEALARGYSRWERHAPGVIEGGTSGGERS